MNIESTPARAPGGFVIDAGDDVSEAAINALESLEIHPRRCRSVEALTTLAQDCAFGCVIVTETPESHLALPTIWRIRQSAPTLVPLVLTTVSDVEESVKLMHAGAGTVLAWPTSIATIAEAILPALEISRSCANDLARRTDAIERLEKLSDTQRKVLTLLFDGLPNKVVAARLDVSLRTIERQRAMSLRALGVKSIVEASELLRLANSTLVAAAERRRNWRMDDPLWRRAAFDQTSVGEASASPALCDITSKSR